mmetsp:Transcript_7963/g.17093  ORF Transcript_7963/g.17093 Transcript_7963/m.17093 type:complete len:252 (-) Transcript_7963:39-794(-)
MADGSGNAGGYGDEDFFKDYPAAPGGAAGGMAGAASGDAGDDPFGAFFGDGAPAGGAAPTESAEQQHPDIMYMPPPVAEEPEMPVEPETMTPAGYGAGGDEPLVGAGLDEAYGGGGGGAGEDDDADSDELPPSRPETPRAIREWRAEFAKRLEEKRKKEEEIRTANLAESKATIERMHERWQERCNANKQLNLEEESRFIAERDALQAQFSAPGEKPNWNMIPQLADLSGGFKKGQRDTSRMRSVILKLKT